MTFHGINVSYSRKTDNDTYLSFIYNWFIIKNIYCISKPCLNCTAKSCYHTQININMIYTKSVQSLIGIFTDRFVNCLSDNSLKKEQTYSLLTTPLKQIRGCICLWPKNVRDLNATITITKRLKYYKLLFSSYIIITKDVFI